MTARASRDRLFQTLTDRGLRPTKDTDDFHALCPVHEDTHSTPSLHVTWREGRVALHCFGCQAPTQDIVEALGLTLSDLFDEPATPREPTSSPPRRTPRQRTQGKARPKAGRLPARLTTPAPVTTAHPEPTHQWATVETYIYVDAAAAIVQEVTRRECTSCPRRHKTFTQSYVSHTGRTVRTKPTSFVPVLYRLPEVRSAITAGTPVWVMEGEKDVHTAEADGLVATTNPGGGAVFAETMADDLADGDVRVVLDRDETGWARGVLLHQMLTARGARVQLLLPATTTAKSDYSDHRAAGHAVTDLQEVTADEVRVWADMRSLSQQLRTIHEADEEADARLALAQAAQADGRAETETLERSHARRWATAAVVRWEALRDDVERLQASADTAGTSWAAQAANLARSMLLQARETTCDIHDRTGQPLPAELRAEQEPARTASTPPTTRPTRTRTALTIPKGHSRPWYELRDNCIVQVRREKTDVVDPITGDPAEEVRETSTLLLNLDVELVAYEYPDTSDASDTELMALRGREGRLNTTITSERRPSHVVFSYTHPATGQQELIRVEYDRAVDSSWLGTLGLAGLVYESKAAGRSRLWDAIRQISLDAAQQTLFVGTGWRLLPEHGWAYVHAGGAITAKGSVPVPVHLAGALRRFDLPDPTDDAQQLRDAWTRHAAPLFEELPARIGIPLIGHMFRAVLGVSPWLGLLVGSPGSRKTGLASVLMHFHGEAWDRRRPAVSMSGNGSTDNAIRFMAHQARDAVLFLDDVAPGKDLTEGQVRMGRIARMLTNGEERARMDRTGLSMNDGTAPATTGLMTSELMPRPGSEAERMFPLPLQATDVPLDILISLDTAEARYGRALLGSSFRQWVAADLPAQQERAATVAGRYTAALRDRGRPDRESDAYGQLYAGWDALSAFLVDTQAITAVERADLMARVDHALAEAMHAAENPDVPLTVGGRVREMLAHALATGLAHLVDIHTGECPTWPMASRLGWRRTPLTSSATDYDDPWRYDARGVFAGYINLEPRPQDGPVQVVMQRLQLEQVLKAAAQGLADAPLMDSGTALRALADSRVLISSRAGGTGSGWTSSRLIPCLGARRRMVVLDLTQLLGDEADGDDGRGGGGWGDPDAPVDDVPPRGHLRSVEAASGVLPELERPAALAPQPQSPLEDEHAVAATPQQPQEAEATYPANDVVNEATQDASTDPAPQPQTREDNDMDASTCCLACGEPVADSILELFGGYHVMCAPDQSKPQEAPARASVDGDRHPAPTVPAAQAPAASLQVLDGRRTTWDGRPERSTACVAVCDLDKTVLGTGQVLPPLTSVDHLGDLALMAERLQLRAPATRHHVEPGTVVLTEAFASSIGLPVDDLPADRNLRATAFDAAGRDHPLLTRAQEFGWTTTGSTGGIRGWTRLTHPDHPAVRIACAPVMVGALVDGIDGPDGTTLGQAPDAAALAYRLQTYADHVGYPWRVNGGATGLDLLVGLRWPDKDRLFTAVEPTEPTKGFLEPDLNWSRIPYADEAQRRYIHVYDRGGSYAAGIAGLELPIGQSVHHPAGRPFDERLPGLWRVDVPEPPDVRMPNPVYVLPHTRGEDGTAWVTTPTLALARMRKVFELPVTVREAYVWDRSPDGKPAHARLMNSWYERIRDARAAMDTDNVDDLIVREMIKETYARTVALMGSRESWVGRTGYFPERRLMIIAKARSNLLYRVAQIGKKISGNGSWPVAMSTDSVAYASDEPDPTAAWPGDPKLLGRGFGQFKPERSGLLHEHLPHLDGHRWTAKATLTPASTWTAQLTATTAETA